MRRFLILFKKEMTENIRRRRFLILVLVFVSFAILSPMSAKYMPDLVKLILSTTEAGGLDLTMPPPVPADSYLQFLKNLTQMGVLLYMLLFMGAITEEKRKGSVVLILTKGVPRSTFLMAKFVSSAFTVVAAYALSCVVFLYYHWLAFQTAPGTRDLLVLSSFAVFLVLMSAMALLAGTLAKSTAMAAVGAIGGYFLLSALAILPVVKDYAPSALSDQGYLIILGKADTGDLLWPIATTLGLAVVLVVIALLSFRRQEI
jgi:ABC-2 type transport system permease protein